MNNNIQGLSHTKWNCKYLIVFAPKYRRKAFYGDVGGAYANVCRKPATQTLSVCLNN